MDFSSRFLLRFFRAKETLLRLSSHIQDPLNQSHILLNINFRNLEGIQKRLELYRHNNTQTAVKFISFHGKSFDLSFKFIHVCSCTLDKTSKFVYACADIGINQFLNELDFTPDRWLKLSLYLLIISEVVGLGHFSKVALRSFSVDLKSA